ncbi:UNVERIFIED_CONTAM: hypothetical protein Scaly_1425400 [Sesamum calycinum]|uniref:Uncharacterized protein n=1 Tax=Sesamum calycinum TaxID=2727403 RepID=A0AAW2PNG6_9LAMI
MYEKNLPNRAGLTPEFEDSVIAFIEWAKHAYMDDEKIKCRGWFDAAESVFWSSTYNEDGVLDDDRFHDALHDVEQPLSNGCTQSQLGIVAKLVDIKVDDHIFERIYDRISQWADHILPRDHSLPLDYYNTNKLIKDLDLSMEKIDVYRNDCMLYWNNDKINLHY